MNRTNNLCMINDLPCTSARACMWSYTRLTACVYTAQLCTTNYIYEQKKIYAFFYFCVDCGYAIWITKNNPIHCKMQNGRETNAEQFAVCIFVEDQETQTNVKWILASWMILLKLIFRKWAPANCFFFIPFVYCSGVIF